MKNARFKRHAVDEDDVVVKVAAVEAEIVVQAVIVTEMHCAAQPGLDRVRDHLLQVGIADEEVSQAARAFGPAQESSAGVGARLASA